MIPSKMTRLQIAQAIETLQTVQKTNSPKSREWQAASPLLHSLYAEMAKREPISTITLFGLQFVEMGMGGNCRALAAWNNDNSHVLITSGDGESLPTRYDWLLACYDADGECLHFFSNGGGAMVRSALEVVP